MGETDGERARGSIDDSLLVEGYRPESCLELLPPWIKGRLKEERRNIERRRRPAIVKIKSVCLVREDNRKGDMGKLSSEMCVLGLLIGREEEGYEQKNKIKIKKKKMTLKRKRD